MSFESVGRALRATGAGKQAEHAAYVARDSAFCTEQGAGDIAVAPSLGLVMNENGSLTKSYPQHQGTSSHFSEETLPTPVSTATTTASHHHGYSLLSTPGAAAYRESKRTLGLGNSKANNHSGVGGGDFMGSYFKDDHLNLEKSEKPNRRRRSMLAGMSKNEYGQGGDMDRDRDAGQGGGGVARGAHDKHSTSKNGTGTRELHLRTSTSLIGGPATTGSGSALSAQGGGSPRGLHGYHPIRGLGSGSEGKRRALWTCFCNLKDGLKSYSAGKLSLRELRSQNIQRLQRLVELGKSLDRPLLRSDRERAGAGAKALSMDMQSPARWIGQLSGTQQHQSQQRPSFLFSGPSSGRPSSMALGAIPFASPAPSASGVLERTPQQRLLRSLLNSAESRTESRGSSSVHASGQNKLDISFAGTPTAATPGSEGGRRSRARSRDDRQLRHFNSVAAMSGGASRAINRGSFALDARTGRSRHPFPPTFNFLLFMGGSYYYYCPSSGERAMIAPGTTTATHPSKPKEGSPEQERSTSTAAAERASPSPVTRQGWGGLMRSVTMKDRQQDKVLASISRGEPWCALPLVPAPDTEYKGNDEVVGTLLACLPAHFVLFLITALLLEQPVLLIAKPGGEEKLMHASAALLKLMAPLQWQYAHIALCHSSASHVLKHAIRSKVPFLIGTHPSVLESVCPMVLVPSATGGPNGPGGSNRLSRSIRRSNQVNINVSPGRAQSQESSATHGVLSPTSSSSPPVTEAAHITIVDLDHGIIHPSKALEYTASATMCFSATSSPGTASAETDMAKGMHSSNTVSSRSSDFIGGLRRHSSINASVASSNSSWYHRAETVNAVKGLLPPMPARYRYRLRQRQERVNEHKGLKGYSEESQGLSNSSHRRKLKHRFSIAKAALPLGQSRRRAKSPPRIGLTSTSPSPPKLSESAKAATAAADEANANPIDAALAAVMQSAASFRFDMFLIMTSLLKSYHMFVGPQKTDSGTGPGTGPGPGQVEGFDKAGMVNFAKDDVRPFLSALLKTRAFGAFLKDGQAARFKSLDINSSVNTGGKFGPVASGQLDFSTLSIDKSSGANVVPSLEPDLLPDEEITDTVIKLATPAPLLVAAPRSVAGTPSDSPSHVDTEKTPEKDTPTQQMQTGRVLIERTFRERFEMAIHARMQQKLRLYRAVKEERLSAFLLSYFIQEGITESLPTAGTASLFTAGLSRAPKVKKRYCVLDGDRFTYYRSRSRRRVKGHFSVNPGALELAAPSFHAHGSGAGSGLTTEHDAVALIIMDQTTSQVSVLMVRAEQVSVHEKWVRALKARLMPPQQMTLMSELY
ncbi:unnamed protein product [Chrysoparadoxa australica]